MRTPAMKQAKPRRATNRKFDISAPTPTTKGGLRALRVIDLKQKLKKHSLKAVGKKENLVNTLFNHIESKKKKEMEEDEEEESSEEIEVEMIGDCIKENDGKRYYEAVKVEDVVYRLEDECYVESNDDANPLWLAKIHELYEENGQCFMNNAWFWKWTEIQNAKIKNKPYNKENPLDPNELFLSSGHKMDRNHIEVIHGKFKVFHSKKEMEKYRKRMKKNKKIETFFCKYLYNLDQKKLIQREIDEENENDIESENEAEENKNNKNDGQKKRRQRGRNKRTKK